MTDNGYIPAQINIQPGQKVVWKNAGQTQRWPAGNSHPTHKDYPSETKSCLGSALDACKAMKVGEQYEFVFDKPGSWGMHDHLSPNDGMVVSVSHTGRGWFGKLRLIFQNLYKKSNKNHNLTPETFRALDYAEQQTALGELAGKDPKAAWELIKDAFIIDGQVTQDVHEFAHLVGHAAYEKQGIAGVGICDASFAYGCFHGVAEEAITKRGEAAVTEIEQACTDNLDEQRRPSCYHGIGHGTAGIHRLKLQPALTACDRMQLENQTYCHDGVFMEHARATQDAGLSRDYPWSLCEDLDELYHVACARYQPTRLTSAGYEFSDGIISCSQTNYPLLQEHCSRAFGFTSVSQGNFDAIGIDELCSNADDYKTADWCRIAAATELVFQSYAGWQQNAPALCALIQNDTARSECNSAVSSIKEGEG